MLDRNEPATLAELSDEHGNGHPPAADGTGIARASRFIRSLEWSRHRRVELLGLPLDALTEAEAIERIMDALAAGRGGWVITPNVDHLRQFRESPDIAALFEAADLVVADGMPLIWASRLAGTPLPARVPGSDLVWSLSAEAALRQRSVFLLGGAPGVGERASAALRSNYPRLRIAGVHSPPYGFEDDPAELDSIRVALRDSKPDLVYVALGFPRQEALIRSLRTELPSTWFIGVGISLSFLAGDVRRAPDWLQRIGLEWAHRLSVEPWRLARRYLIHDLPVAVRLAGHSLMARARGGLRTRPVAFARPRPGSTRVRFTHGALERRRAAELASLIPPQLEQAGQPTTEPATSASRVSG